MNFLTCEPGCGLEYEGDMVDVWISVKFGFLSSLGHVSWSGACSDKRRVAGDKDHKDIQICGRTVEVKEDPCAHAHADRSQRE